MTNLPDRTTDGVPERRLSNRDFELVIRRAAELQAREAEEVGGSGITEGETVKIGRELGLSAENIQRALAEVGAGTMEEAGLMRRLYGPAGVRAGRVVRGEKGEVARLLEGYLAEREYLAVLRRFPDRVVFARATGVAAGVGRAAAQIFNRSPLLNVANLEMAVQEIEPGACYVTLLTRLEGQRTAAAAGSLVGGGSAAGVSGVVLAIAIAPPAALLALPVLAAAIYGGHAYYEAVLRSAQIRLESLLDRLEHGELSRLGGRAFRR